MTTGAVSGGGVELAAPPRSSGISMWGSPGRSSRVMVPPTVTSTAAVAVATIHRRRGGRPSTSLAARRTIDDVPRVRLGAYEPRRVWDRASTRTLRLLVPGG